MTLCAFKQLADLPGRGQSKRCSPARVSPNMLEFVDRSGGADISRCRRAMHLVFALSLIAFALSPEGAPLLAQPPSGEVPAAVDDGTTTTSPSPANSASNPESVDFDIDLGTEEFENFGEEDFQVEEADYFRDTLLPVAIKVGIGAAVILLLAWVAMKLVKPKPPTAPN